MQLELKHEGPTQQRFVWGHGSVDPASDHILLLVQEQRWSGQGGSIESRRLPAFVLGLVLMDAHGF